MSNKIRLKAADGHELDAYVAEPKGKAKGGLVVVQEIFGVNSHIKSVADGYARDGYLAAAKALTEMTPEQIIDEMKKSGLRGRGGAGFPTGLKWEESARAKADQKFMICNGDEGDPGAFMDRSVLESDPHRVLEGMAIAAYAVGASQGYLYVRAEYPLAVQRLKTAIRQADRLGLRAHLLRLRSPPPLEPPPQRLAARARGLRRCGRHGDVRAVGAAVLDRPERRPGPEPLGDEIRDALVGGAEHLPLGGNRRVVDQRHDERCHPLPQCLVVARSKLGRAYDIQARRASIIEVDPATLAAVQARGFAVRTVDVAELQKAEAGGSCMSLVFVGD